MMDEHSVGHTCVHVHTHTHSLECSSASKMEEIEAFTI